MPITKSPIFMSAFALLVLLGVMHNLGSFLYLYWTIWWYDIPMHFLGGLTSTLFLLWLIFWSGYFYKSLPNKKTLFIYAFIGSLVVGVVWEYFEIVTYVIVFPSDLYDSISDLLFDLLGGLTAYLLIFKKHI